MCIFLINYMVSVCLFHWLSVLLMLQVIIGLYSSLPTSISAIILLIIEYCLMLRVHYANNNLPLRNYYLLLY